MKASQVLALFAVLGSAAAQGVTSILTPPYDAPPACGHSVDGKFELVKAAPEDFLAKRQEILAYKRGGVCEPDNALIAELKDGILTDPEGRTGYIASNYQFQFDDPPQSGALYTAGWAHCPNGSLALGANTFFWACTSGDFSNIYDRWFAHQCTPIHLLLRQCDENGEIGPNDHVIGTNIVTTTMIVPLHDGQPQIITTTVADPICEIDDGALKGQTTPCSAIAGIPKVDITMAPLSELSDGQIQLTPLGSQPPVTSSEATTTSDPSSPSTTLASAASSAPMTSAPPTTMAPSQSSNEPERDPPQTTKSGDAERSVRLSALAVLIAGLIGLMSVV